MTAKTFIHHATFVAGLFAASCAQAQICNNVLATYTSIVYLYPVSAELFVSGNPVCFGGPLTSYNQINATSFAQASAISQSFAMQQPIAGPGMHAQAAGLRGMSGGNGASQWNIWGNVNNNDTRLQYLSSFGSDVRNDAKITTATFGTDYALTPAMSFGFSGAYDDGDGSGHNNGLIVDTTDTRGWLFAPYFGWRIDNALALDISAGWGRGRTKTTSNTEAKATRWFGAANLNYSRWLDNWQLSGRASYLHGVEDYDDTVDLTLGTPYSGTRAKNTLGQIRLHTQAGYWMGGIMPFISLAYSNDIYRRTTLYGASGYVAGKDGWLVGAGMNAFSLKNGMTGGIVYTQESGRSHQKFHSLTANLSQRF